VKKNRDFAGVFCIGLVSCFVSCTDPTPVQINEKSITEFHQLNEQTANKLNSGVDLFIDYSTCVAEAVRSSDFFSHIRPRITGLNPVLYSIKGDAIDSVSSNKDIINQEISLIKEISYSNLEAAGQIICTGNDQAILVTDGEYWTVGAGERTDLAYLKDPFIKWLVRGFDIYVYIEDYEERYFGQLYSKKRFYFLFTDDKLANNIYQELNKAFIVSPLSESLHLIKLSNTDIQISNHLTVFPDLDSKVITDKDFTAIEILSDWESLDEFVLYAKDPESGSSVPGGTYLVRGLKMTSDPGSSYSYPELSIKVYNVSQSYLNNEKADLSACEIQDFFILDEELYKSNGEIGIKLSEDYYNSLNAETENLLRIDIFAKKTDKNIQRNDFEWKSMSKAGTNSSVFESVLQTVDNASVDPSFNHQVLYTIYLKTGSL